MHIDEQNPINLAGSALSIISRLKQTPGVEGRLDQSVDAIEDQTLSRNLRKSLYENEGNEAQRGDIASVALFANAAGLEVTSERMLGLALVSEIDRVASNISDLTSYEEILAKLTASSYVDKIGYVLYLLNQSHSEIRSNYIQNLAREISARNSRRAQGNKNPLSENQYRTAAIQYQMELLGSSELSHEARLDLYKKLFAAKQLTGTVLDTEAGQTFVSALTNDLGIRVSYTQYLAVWKPMSTRPLGFIEGILRGAKTLLGVLLKR